MDRIGRRPFAKDDVNGIILHCRIEDFLVGPVQAVDPAMREINAKAQRLARNEQEREDDEMAVLLQGWDAPVLPERIPRLMAQQGPSWCNNTSRRRS